MAENNSNFPLKFLQSIVGGLTLLNLINDLKLITLYGKLAKWIDAYSLFVHKVTDFLFGWIDFLWFKVDNIEANLLIIFSIISLSYHRADDKVIGKHYGESGLFVILILQFFTVSVASLVALIFPTPLTVICLGGILVLFIYTFYFEDVDAHIYRQELAWILLAFLFLIAINYLWFK
ncbi:MAG: hypothetical protein KGV51_03820 [Moraxellaceae bacterium]|nr:hypothetical protein [Moraxellaceae bacterium]